MCWSLFFLLLQKVNKPNLQLQTSSVPAGKVFERCEFARELVNHQGFARATVGNWVCLANVGWTVLVSVM